MRSSKSTRPRSQTKVHTDEADIMLLIQLLADMKMKLALEDYAGKTRGQLLPLVAIFHDSLRKNEEFCATLREAMHPEDWEEMLRTADAASGGGVACAVDLLAGVDGN
ncbi:hypothetical protein C8Q80DRAFT_1092407 [Daedaleopsis nitida]|nr:hypothetical protein C8Q80DRAFT_1092407 [Daedaleopsis nitida]